MSERSQFRMAAQRQPAGDPMFTSYVQLAQGLIGDLSGACLMDHHWRMRGTTGHIAEPLLRKWTAELGWNGIGVRQPASVAHTPGEWTTAIPLEQSDTTLLGVFCVSQSLPILPTYPARHAIDIAGRLKPLLDCVHRDLAAALPVRERVQTLTERTAELEWLFKITGELRHGAGDGSAIHQLLSAATLRMSSALGICDIPDKRLSIEHAGNPPPSEPGNSGWGDQGVLRGVWRQTRQHLLNWATRRNSPLVVNGAERDGDRIPRCKILSVPIARDNGRVIGVLAFFNPPFAPNYASRHVYLARHLGVQAATVIDLQYDLMTGLYSRSALEQMHGGPQPSPACLIYLDVDRMHVVNDIHGFEIGNEVLVRIADLLSAPQLPEDAVAARLSGDRFAVIVPHSDVHAMLALAQKIQAAVRYLKIGPEGQVVEVSVGCGVASLPPVTAGLERALAAAEIACKAAKRRGSGHAEIHAGDILAGGGSRAGAVAIGRLRAALKADRLQLMARRTRPLKDEALPGGYELSIRMQDEDGAVVSGQALSALADRHHFSPTLDRWAVQRSVQLLGPYRRMLTTRGLCMTVRISEESLADPTTLAQLGALLSSGGLPSGCLTLAIGEQSAARHLPRALELSARLREWGCRLALSDFEMGKDALQNIRTLGIARIQLAARGAAPAVQSIVEFASSLGVDTVGECHTADDLASCRTLGLDYAQGDGVESARPLDEVLRDLSEDESRRLGRLYLEL